VDNRVNKSHPEVENELTKFRPCFFSTLSTAYIQQHTFFCLKKRKENTIINKEKTRVWKNSVKAGDGTAGNRKKGNAVFHGIPD